MLNDRKEKILKLIVEEQIKTCRPVGSSSLCDKLKVSSATIRNDMSALENLGYFSASTALKQTANGAMSKITSFFDNAKQ